MSRRQVPVAALGLVLANIAAFAIELAAGGMAVCQAHGVAPGSPVARKGASVSLVETERLGRIAWVRTRRAN